MSGRAELGAVGQLQAEILHLDLIDGADGYHSDQESLKASATAPPPVTKDPIAPVTMDTYRPKRPTTLNLFPIVPRTQVKLCESVIGLRILIGDHVFFLSVFYLTGKCKILKTYYFIKHSCSVTSLSDSTEFTI